MDTTQEPTLVRDVLSACQGISSHTVSCSPDADGDIALSITDRLSPPQQQLIARLCEFGWLFRRAQRQSRAVAGTAQDQAPGGVVRQAFMCSVQTRLAEQYQMLALLQAQLQSQLPAPGKGSQKVMPYLTLKRLQLWLDAPTQQLRQLCLLLDATRDQQGGRLLTTLYLHTRHGAQAAGAVAEEVLLQAAEPLLAAVWRWLTAGQLPDRAADDFFIEEAQGRKAPAANLWQERYRVEEARLPHFITPPLAADILRTGKSVVFLRECCSDADFKTAAAREELWPSGHRSFLEGGALGAAVAKLSSSVDTYLLLAVIGRAGAMRHCAAMRQYLLADAGDFVAALLDAIGPELDGKAADTSEYALNGGLAAAVCGSSARHESADVTDRLRVRLHRGSSLETGWERFGLLYDLDEPLATALTPHAATGYKRLSRFVWALARAQHALQGGWQALGRTQRHLSLAATLQRRLGLDDCPPLEPAAAALRMLHSSRAAMATFCTALQAFVHMEVLPSAWSRFETRAAAAGCLDDWIAAHEAYVDSMQGRLLLAPPAEPLARGHSQAAVQASLQGALADAAEVAHLCRVLEAEAAAAARGLAAAAKRAARRQRAGQWAVTEEDADIAGLELGRTQGLQEAAASASARFAEGRATVAAAFNAQARIEGRVAAVFTM